MNCVQVYLKGDQVYIKGDFELGFFQGYIKGEYELFGHKDGRCTLCPGDLLYADLQGWPHYSKRQIPVYCPSK